MMEKQEKLIYTPEMLERDIDIFMTKIPSRHGCDSIFGIPRGGIPLAVGLSEKLNLHLVSKPNLKTLIVDDIVDSGKTRLRYKQNQFASIHVKTYTPEDFRPQYYLYQTDKWIDYFWETNESTIEDHIIRQIQYIGEDPCRQGMIETPKRIVASWGEIFQGYKQDPESVFKTFEDEQEQFGGLVYLKGIEFYSICEHHWLPFFGQAFVAYIPNGPVIGVSKLARLLDIYARRFQMQERIGEQVTNSLMKHLNPVGAACLTEAKHLCISCRGVKKQHAIMGYSSMKGVFLDDSNKGIAARNELMALWGKP